MVAARFMARGTPIRRTTIRRTRRAGIVLGAATVVLIGNAGGAFASYSEDHRYTGAMGTDPEQSVYAWFQHLPGDQRIATTGLALAYPLTGPRLTSRITYLGPDVKGALDDYSSCQAWTAAVARTHANYVVTAPLLPGSSVEPAASTWAQHDPAFAQVFKQDSIRVFSVVGTVSPRQLLLTRPHQRAQLARRQRPSGDANWLLALLSAVRTWTISANVAQVSQRVGPAATTVLFVLGAEEHVAQALLALVADPGVADLGAQQAEPTAVLDVAVAHEEVFLVQ